MRIIIKIVFTFIFMFVMYRKEKGKLFIEAFYTVFFFNMKRKSVHIRIGIVFVRSHEVLDFFKESFSLTEAFKTRQKLDFLHRL